MANPKRIRSNYQRKVLDWLADGGGTVSDVAKALELRMPHASSALKQLRESGDVVRDEENIRGSFYRVTAQGISRIESDELYRLINSVTWPPPPGAAGIVLSRDDSMLLLGYTSQPSGPLLGLPDRPIEVDNEGVKISSGKEGAGRQWVWAVQRNEQPTWWDIETKRKTDAPDQTSSQTLSAWMERPKVIGIVKARLLDNSESWPLGVGSWFEELPEGYWPDLPKVLTEGDLAIGKAGNTGPKVSPRGPIQARIGKRTDKSALLESLPSNTLKIVDAAIAGIDHEPLPYEILRHWLKLVHPRLNEKSLNSRFNKLKNELGKISNSNTRKVLNDFPGKEWSESNSKFLDTTSVTARGAIAIVEYALEKYDSPIALDWRWAADETILGRFVNDTKGKLLICDNTITQSQFILNPLKEEGKFELTTANRLRIPISMGAKISAPKDWIAPKSPYELVRGSSQTAKDVDDEIDALWQAVNLESGDDRWADKHEARFPLAAWIASSRDSHQSRWRRIGHLLNPEWASLADNSSFDDEDISELAILQNDALDELIHRIRNNPLIIRNLDLNNPAVATAILLSEEWLDGEYDVVETWVNHPIRSDEILSKNWNSSNISRLVEVSRHHKLLLNNEPLSRSEMLAIMEDVNHLLWAHKAKIWLLSCLASNVGRTALSTLELPWPVILSQSEVNSEELNLVYHMPEGIGTDSLLDSIEGLHAYESGKTPPIGRTHPYAGWLFQDKIPTIPLECDSNLEIHIALHRRIQG